MSLKIGLQRATGRCIRIMKVLWEFWFKEGVWLEWIDKDSKPNLRYLTKELYDKLMEDFDEDYFLS